ncbi:MAG: hypothetical protein ABSF24_10160 [Candidatus Bathyarchaeia archaeon]
MKDKNKDDMDSIKEEVKILKEEKINLEEKLQLQKSNWLFSHHRLFSISFGLAYGLAIACLIYFLAYIFSSTSLSFGETGISTLFVIPLISAFPPALWIRAPRFTIDGLRIYVFSFMFFETMILYFDPTHTAFTTYQSNERISSALGVSVFLGFLVAFSVALAIPIVKKCGYRLVLNGSAMSFTANADVNIVMEQLKKLEEDFNLTLSRKTSNSLYFVKTYGNKKSVLQFLLRPADGRTDGVLVMHSVVNDIPMRPDPKEIKTIGETLLKWFVASTGLEVATTENRPLIDESIQESKRSFYRQAIALPSKKSARKFLDEHWKDIALIVSVVVAVVAYLFPRKG